MMTMSLALHRPQSVLATQRQLAKTPPGGLKVFLAMLMVATTAKKSLLL
jgi:hypothetical protein